MLLLNSIQEKLKSVYPDLVRRYPIKSLSLFGSVARQEASATSDIDILVEFSQPVGFQFFNLARELEQILGYPVDLVSRNGIKPHYFAEIKPDLIYVEAE